MECYTSQFLALAKSCSPKSNFAAATAAASLPFLILMCQYRELTAKNKRCWLVPQLDAVRSRPTFCHRTCKISAHPKWHKETMTPAESGKRRHLQPHDSDQLHTLRGWWETLLGISNLYELHEIANNGDKNCDSMSVRHLVALYFRWLFP